MNALRLSLALAGAFGVGVATGGSIGGENRSPFDDPVDPRVPLLREAYSRYQVAVATLYEASSAGKLEKLEKKAESLEHLVDSGLSSPVTRRRLLTDYGAELEAMTAARDLSATIGALRRNIEAGPYNFEQHIQFTDGLPRIEAVLLKSVQLEDD